MESREEAAGGKILMLHQTNTGGRRGNPSSLSRRNNIEVLEELDEEKRGKDGRAERGSLWQRLDQCDDTRLTRGDCKEVCLFFKRKIDLILNLTQLCYQQTPHMFRVSRKAITKQMAAICPLQPIFHLISNIKINISIF